MKNTTKNPATNTAMFPQGGLPRATAALFRCCANRTGLLLCTILVACLGLTATACAGEAEQKDLVFVEDGQPRASIVIAENPPRMVDLAARELQETIEKISGAKLPIGTEPDPDYPVTIYVGRSAFTDAQGITDEGLLHGAYRMVSGPDWLVLLGRDRDFEPREPWPRTRDDFERTQKEWEQISGVTSDNPMNWYGGTATSRNRALGIWRQDEGGSLQAVYGFLRDLGARWFWPGETGEVLPKLSTIAVPPMDVTVHPDFPIRYFSWYSAFHAVSRDDLLWSLRLGLNDPYPVLGASMHAHGMRAVMGNETMQREHPEFYALSGGRRITDYRGTGHASFTSPGLQEATVKYVRAIFDHFDEPAVDLWPQDGLIRCEIDASTGKSASDVAFEFVDRVAREVYKTHPDRLITTAAYTSYVEPPESIEKFSPNVAVFIANRGRAGFVEDFNWERYQNLISAWQEKLAPGRIIRYENNLGLPPHPRAYAKDLRAMKGISLGETNEVIRSKRPQKTHWPDPATNHLNYYVNARLLWDADQDLDVLLDEYYDLFYGPAAEPMREAYDYVQANYARRGRARLDLEHQVAYVEKLHAALAAAGDNEYGARIQKHLDELPPLEKLQADLQARIEAGDPRRNAPTVVARKLPSEGKPKTHQLVGILNGEKPEVETTFTVAWENEDLVFDIICHEPEMDKLSATPDVYNGDSVSLLVETPYLSYYQVEVNPDGVVFDSDRSFGERADAWNSQATVETERGPDFWRVVIRLPIANEFEGSADPLHQIVGDRPTAEKPWFFNLGRVRVAGAPVGERTSYSFVPTGKATFHNPDSFARLVVE